MGRHQETRKNIKIFVPDTTKRMKGRAEKEEDEFVNACGYSFPQYFWTALVPGRDANECIVNEKYGDVFKGFFQECDDIYTDEGNQRPDVKDFMTRTANSANTIRILLTECNDLKVVSHKQPVFLGKIRNKYLDSLDCLIDALPETLSKRDLDISSKRLLNVEQDLMDIARKMYKFKQELGHK